jgi:hypothetical protein
LGVATTNARRTQRATARRARTAARTDVLRH